MAPKSPNRFSRIFEVFRIDRIAQEFLGNEITTGADGQRVFKRIYEPTLKAEMAGADGSRKSLSFHATRTPNVFAHVTADGERMRPFIAGAAAGRAEVRVTLDADGYPTLISVRGAGDSKSATAKFSGYGTLPRPTTASDGFS